MWDDVILYFTDFHKEDEELVLLVTGYSDDVLTFHNCFIADRVGYEQLRGFNFKKVPENIFNISGIPRIKYKSFDIHVFDEGKYLAPVIT